MRNQIDYILIKRRWKSSIVNSRTLPSADIDSDHNLLYADVCLKLKRLKKSRTIDKYDLESIKAPDIQERYAVEIKKTRFQLLTTAEKTLMRSGVTYKGQYPFHSQESVRKGKEKCQKTMDQATDSLES